MGRIAEFQVKNYRSISNSGQIPLSGGITPLIGKNGAGKSSALSGLAELSSDSPISQSDLSRYSDISQVLGDTEIVTIRIENLHEERYPFFAGPFRPEDLESEILEFENINLTVSDHLDPNEVTLSKFGNGRRVIEFSDEDTAPELDIYEFIRQRSKDLIALAKELVNQLAELDYIDKNISSKELEELSDINKVLEKVMTEMEGGNSSTDSERSTPEMESILADIESIQTRAAEMISTDRTIDSILPPVIDLRDFEQIPSELDLTADSRLSVGFLELQGLSQKQFQDLSEDQQSKQIEMCTNRLQSYLNGFWDQRDDLSETVDQTFPEEVEKRYEIRPEIDGSRVKFFLSENTAPSVEFSNASTGIQWVITFLLNILSQTGEDLRDAAIVIVDDAGEYLHPGAQDLLLSTFMSLSAGNQIIFGTHSPFMLDIKRISAIRVVEWDPEEGSSITKAPPRPVEGQIDQWQPIRAALGAKIARLPFGSEATVVVEGKTEMDTFERLYQHFRNQNDRETIERDVRFIDSKGTHSVTLSKYLTSEKLTHVVLLDDDEGGDGTRNAFENEEMETDHVYDLSQLMSDGPEADDVDLEQVFGMEAYAHGVWSHLSLDVELEEYQSIFESEMSRADSVFSAACASAAPHLDDPSGIGEKKAEFSEETVTVLIQKSDQYAEILDRFEDILISLNDHLDQQEEDNGS